jgi:hypothetical protein
MDKTEYKHELVKRYEEDCKTNAGYIADKLRENDGVVRELIVKFDDDTNDHIFRVQWGQIIYDSTEEHVMTPRVESLIELHLEYPFWLDQQVFAKI